MLSVGSLSEGNKDLCFRAGLFRSLIQCMGLSESADIRCDGSNLYLESETVKYFENVVAMGKHKASDVGHCIYWASGGCPIRIDDGSMRPMNFSTLSFSHLETDHFLMAAKRCTEHFCSLGPVVQTDLWLSEYDGDYDELRSFLSANFPCTDWRLMISGRSKYGIDDLDKMFEETDSLLLPLFVIKDRRVGEINMELGYDKGSLTLNFSTYTEEIDKAEKVIRQIVAELSDGKVVIDEECF